MKYINIKNDKKKKREGLIKIIKLVEKDVKNYNVPVVTMIANNKGNPFKILISTILSLRTRDETTLKATERLFEKAKTPEEMYKLSEKQIQKLIYPVGFYRVKAKNIKKVCKIIIDKHKGKTPRTMKDLLELPNVGRKTANLVLTLGYGIIDGIAIDTHCHRIPNRIGIIKTKTPEDTEKEIMNILPKRYWNRFNDNFVAFGQGRCKPIGPRCINCPVKEFCAYYKKHNMKKQG